MAESAPQDDRPPKPDKPHRSHAARVRPSLGTDDSAHDEFLDAIKAHDAKADEYKAAAQDHLNLADAEKLAKAQKLRKTKLGAFVGTRCEESGIPAEDARFSIDNTGNLRHSTNYCVLSPKGQAYPDNQQRISRLKTALEQIGVPRTHIKSALFYGHPTSNGRPVKDKTVPVEYVYITVDQSLISALIEKETEKRFAPIRLRYEEAAGEAHNKLGVISKMIEQAAGHKVIDKHPERDLGFTQSQQQRVRDDIRNRVTHELLDGPGRTRNRGGQDRQI